MGALKTLLLEVLASARSTSAAANNAQLAANAATAAMEAVVTLRANMDSALEAVKSGAAAAAAEAVSAALGKGGGAAESAHLSCERTSSRPTREKEAPNANGIRMMKSGGGSDSLGATLAHLVTSLEPGSGIRSTSAAAEAAANITLGDRIVPDFFWGEKNADGAIVRDKSEAIIEETSPCPPCTLLTPGLLTPGSSRLHACPSECGVTDAQLATLLAAAMRPVRGELKRLRAAMFDVRSGQGSNIACSSAPPSYSAERTSMSLPYWPYPDPPPMQHYRRRRRAAAQIQVGAPDQISPPSSARRRIRLTAAGRSTEREARGSKYSSPVMNRTRHDAGGGGSLLNSAGSVASAGGGFVSWLMGPARRLEPDDQGPAASPSPYPPSSLLPAS